MKVLGNIFLEFGLQIRAFKARNSTNVLVRRRALFEVFFNGFIVIFGIFPESCNRSVKSVNPIIISSFVVWKVFKIWVAGIQLIKDFF